jgi:hypothetical protein
MSTGPGLPSWAMRKASLKVHTSWAGSLTCTAHLVTGLAISTMSTAWKASLWSRFVGACPVMQIWGIESAMQV